jgi:hypothetical protein
MGVFFLFCGKSCSAFLLLDYPVMQNQDDKVYQFDILAKKIEVPTDK